MDPALDDLRGDADPARRAGVEVREQLVQVGGRPARVWVGGHGVPLLLAHGGWGGAGPCWGSVWQPLAERFRVIAPELPGIGDPDQPGLGSLAAYGVWLDALLDVLDVRSAWCVGNSFGVSVIARFALDAPKRCLGLVFVNGFPLPPTPELLRRLGERELGQRLVRAIERRVAYRPSALRRGFFDPTRAPRALRDLLRQREPAGVDALVEVLVRGGGAPGALPVPPLLLWGESDHLPGTSRRAAKRLQRALPGSKLVFVPGAGHMPQVERPDAFVAALAAFVRAPHA